MRKTLIARIANAIQPTEKALKRYRVMIAAMTMVIIPSVAAHAADLFSPGLPAMGTEIQVCRIINVTDTRQTVTTEAKDSNGVTAAGPYTQTLAPGEAGGLAVSAVAASVYCKFTVKGDETSKAGFRASIEIFDPTVAPGLVKTALSAY